MKRILNVRLNVYNSDFLFVKKEMTIQKLILQLQGIVRLYIYLKKINN